MLFIHKRNNFHLVGVRSDENLRSPLLHSHSLSDSSLATAFFIFFVTNRSNLPSKLGKSFWSTKLCIDERTFCLHSA